MSPATDVAPTHGAGPSRTDVRTARLLVAGQFVLIAIIMTLPRRHDWQVATGLIVDCSVSTVLGLAVMVIGATTPRFLPVRLRWWR